MIDSKPWYLSKTIWAAFVSVAASGAAAIGLPADPALSGAMADAVLHAVAAIAGVVAVFGRMTATRRIE